MLATDPPLRAMVPRAPPSSPEPVWGHDVAIPMFGRSLVELPVAKIALGHELPTGSIAATAGALMYDVAAKPAASLEASAVS